MSDAVNRAAAMTPEQARFIFETVSLLTLRFEHPTTAAVIAAIPAEHRDYRPHPESRAAFELARHIVSAEMRYVESTIAGVFPYDAAPVPVEIDTPADLVAWYDRWFGDAIARLERVSGDDLLRIVDFYGIRKMPALTLLQIIASHTIHHRGQLSAYLRPMGAKVPSIYGESFDARKAREAAAPTS